MSTVISGLYQATTWSNSSSRRPSDNGVYARMGGVVSINMAVMPPGVGYHRAREGASVERPLYDPEATGSLDGPGAA